MKNFFTLEPEDGIMFSDKWAYGEVIDPTYGEANRCHLCNKFISMKEWLPPHKVQFSTNDISKWGDFVWGAGFTLLVSDYFKEIFQDNILKSHLRFSSPIEIINSIEGSPIYYHVDIPWNGANLNDKLSGLNWYKPQNDLCEFCRTGSGPKRIEKIILDEASWLGEDMFIARGLSGFIIVSKKLKEIIEESPLKNYWLIPTNKIRIDTRGTEKLWEIID